MRTSTSLFAVSCFAVIPVVFCAVCNTDTCFQVCPNQSARCPIFDCGQAKQNCTQVCEGLNTPCKALTCSAKHCEQNCLECPKDTTLNCSAENCVQICSGQTCEMECTKEVKTCRQVCTNNSKCSLTCHTPDTNCTQVCKDGNCEYLPMKVPEVQVTDTCDANKCVKNCTGPCKDVTLRCSNVTECSLSCGDGCTMICDNTVDKCSQECIGNTKCKTTCEAKSCNFRGVCSSAEFHQLSRMLYMAVPVSLVLGLM